LSTRESVLARIREALRKEAPRPHDAPKDFVKGAEARSWLPEVPQEIESQIALFAKNIADLRARFFEVRGEEGATAKLVEIKTSENWDQVATHRSPLLDRVVGKLALPVLYAEDRPRIEVLEKSPVGITLCDALVAQTGSVLLTAKSAGGRSLSVFPPHHVVLASCDQMLPDLPAAFELLQKRYGGNYPSFCTFITGGSRTSDIERVLVLGAHGPRVLTIILMRDVGVP
jgi:L-lactate dehydrogenase complex protein LldG